jgi:two-component system, OmpR family, sensor histidine kinase VicK
MLVIPNHPVTNVCIDLKNRGVKIRFITEITKDNIKYCIQLMKIAETRHLDDIKGNFGVGDKRVYQGSATTIKSEVPPQMIISTVKSFVEQQQSFFDMLWHKAMPAKHRIKEIELHMKRQFIDTIQDGVEINDLVHKLIKSAREEILILFPTTNTFYRYESEGLMKLIKDAAALSGMKIRILIYLDNVNKRESINQDYTVGDRVRILMFEKSELRSKVITIIIDNEYSLGIELNDDGALDSTNAVGFATYSNSDSTVATYVSIFETLWVQAELRNKQSEITSIRT